MIGISEREMPMRVIVNGKFTVISDDSTIQSYLESKGINLSDIIVERNFELPPREKWGSITLKENDTLEIVKPIGGG